MRSWSFLALLVGVLFVTAPFVSKYVRAQEEEFDEDDEEEPAASDDEKDVVVLTTSNFDDIVGNAKFALVEFYAPWCGHCQKLKPEWAKAATQIKEIDPTIVIAKIDATEEKDLGTKFGVSGYPTIKWFVNGEPSEYNGPREADGIVKWVAKRTGPPAVTLETVESLEDLEAAEPAIILGFFDAFEGAEWEAFQKVGQTTEDVSFAQTTSADVAKAAGLTGKGIVAVTNFAGEGRVTIPFNGDFSDDDIKEFVTAEKLPPTIEFNDANSQKIFGSGVERQLILVARAKDFTEESALFTDYRKVAKQYKGKAIFVTVDLDGSSKDPVVNYFSIKEEDAPILIGFEMAKNKKYRFKAELTEDAIAEFALSVIDGSAEPDYKSAPIPDDPKDADVTIVVGKSFDAVVKDAKKDVLLEVYAPWCGHCKQLEPIYKKLAKRFKKVESVVIAKMDGTENEHPDVDVKGFPTILFFPAGQNKNAISYDGSERTLKALTKFIKSNAKVPFELPKKAKGGDDEAAHDEL